jgi:hypothetical protein
VDGRWPDYQTEINRFPNAHHLSISAFATDNADCLDIETGDATNSQAPAWVARQRQQGNPRPALYTSLSNAQTLIDTLDQAGIPRHSYRLWTAHYDPTLGSHLCKPSCGYQFKDLADATQWTDHQGAWDESLLLDDFFTITPPAPEPTHLLKEGTVIHFNDNQYNYIAGAAADNGNLLVFRMNSLTDWECVDVTDVMHGKNPSDPRWYRVN